MYVECMANVCRMSAECLSKVCQSYGECMSNVCRMYVECMSNVWRMGEKCKKWGRILCTLLRKLWLLTARISTHSKVVKYVKWGSYTPNSIQICHYKRTDYRGAGKSLARPGRKQATATEDFDFHISYL